MLLARKLGRELRRQKGQSVAVFVVTSLGIFLFVASAGAYLDLRDSYASTRARLALADWHVELTRGDASTVARIRELAGVRDVEARTVTAVPASVGDERVELRLLSLPDGGQPSLDQVLLTEGRLPVANDEVIVEKHLAQHHHLAPGSSIRVVAGGLTIPLKVCGVGVSAEYLWVARDEHDVMPSPDAFGVAWMRRSALRGVAGAIVSSATTPVELPGLEVAAGNDDNELLVAGVQAPDVEQTIRETIGSQLMRITPAAELPGVRLLQMDVDGYKGMAAFFPLLFLAVAAFIIAALLARTVDAQRPLVGTLTALGVGRERVLLHYLSYALLLGGTGGVVGAVTGVFAAPALTHEYAAELGIPFVSAVLRWHLAVDGMALAVAVALLAGVAPAWHASTLQPAEAMRPPRPSTGPLARAVRHVQLSLPLRMALRDVLGRPLRSLGTVAGVAGALLLVLTTGAMLDSMRAMVSIVFHDARRYDLRVDFAEPTTIAEVRDKLDRLQGVSDVEAIVLAPVTLSAGARQASNVLLQGLPNDSQLLRSMDLDGTNVPPAEHGIVVTRDIASTLKVRIGDEVTARVPSQTASVSFRVTGFADAALGKTASVRRDDLARAMGLGDIVTSAVLTVHPGSLASVRRALAADHDVAHVEDLAQLRDQIRQAMGFGWLLLAMMLACSVVLAAAVLFNTATLGILERRRELATLRALGYTLREIALGLTLEHALLCVAGLAVGFPLAVVAIRRVLALYSSDLFRLPFVLSPSTALVAGLGVLLVLLLAQWPALRQVGRDSLADAVRSREG